MMSERRAGLEDFTDAPLLLDDLYDIFGENAEAMMTFLRDESIPSIESGLLSLAAAIADENGEQAILDAHRLRGSSAMIGALNISAALGEIEDDLRRSDWQHVPERFVIATAHLQRVAVWLAERNRSVA